jgi:zinc transport system substrate-binding protein
MAETAAGALMAADPERVPVYEANLRALCADLERTDENLRRILAPVRGRSLYVFHPAWGYFCDEYGLRQVSVELEGKEPSDHELTMLINRARADRVRVLFVQPQVSGRSAAAIAEAAGATLRVVDPLRADVLANLEETAAAVAEALR